MKRKLKTLFHLMCTLFLAACAFQILHAQERVGVIVGRVLDATTNQPVIGANVVLVGTSKGAATDAEGRFRIASVPLGLARIRVSAVGYIPAEVTDIVVTTAKTAQVLVRLEEAVIPYEGVEVSATPFEKVPETPLSIYTQSNEEIRRLPGGFEDVVRAISILPGVAQAEPGRNDLIVRGGAPSENLYVVENIELSNINHFGTQGASGGPLSFINLDFVRATAFSTGGFGVPYGDKLSSLLTISLRDASEEFGGKATLSATQFGLNLEGPIVGNGSVLFSARRSYLDFIFKAAGFGFVPEYWDFLLSTKHRLSSSDNLSVIGIAALDNTRLFNDTPEKRFNNSRVLASDQQQYIAGVSWQHLFPSGYSRLTASRTDVTFAFRQDDSLLVPIFRSNAREIEMTLRGDLLYQVKEGLELTVGAQAKFIQFQSDIVLNPVRTSYQDPLALRAVFDTSALKASGYLQLSNVLGNVRFTLGGRVEHFSMIENKTAFTPRVAASYKLSGRWSINVSVGDYAQSPAYIWLVANPINRQLEHLRAVQWIAGVDWLLRGDTKVTLETYFKRYRNYPTSLTRPYLVLSNTGAGFGGVEDGFASFGFDPLVSVGTGRAYGIELFVQKKLSDIPCYGTLSLSYGKALTTAADGIERAGSFDQRWVVNVGGGYVFDERWELSGRFRFASGRPYTPFEPDGSQNPSRYNSVRVRANHSLDLRVDRRWHFDRWTLITSIDVQNIYNRKPVSIPRYNARTGTVEESAAIGILPSIGISAEF